MQLGVKVKDKITGFKGVVTAHCRYITGCNQVLVQPESGKDGAFNGPHWFDEQRLEKAGNKIVSLDNRKTPGFDVAAPKR